MEQIPDPEELRKRDERRRKIMALEEATGIPVKERANLKRGERKKKLRKKFTVMAMDVHEESSAVAWVRLDKPVNPAWGDEYEWGPVDALAVWFEYVGMEDCTRRIFHPAPEHIGKEFSRGVYKTYERRLLDFIIYRRANLVLTGGPEADWLKGRAEGDPRIEKLRMRQSVEFRDGEWRPFAELDMKVLAGCKLYTPPMMDAILGLVRDAGDDWEEL